MVKVGFAGNSSEFIWVSLRISKFRLQEGLRCPDANTMTSPALISVKASLTRMTPLLAAGCGALRVTLLSVEPEHEWAVGEELPLFLFLSLSWVRTRRSDPPKSTSSSKLPVASGGGARTSMAAKFSTLRDFGSLTGGQVAVAWLSPVSTDRALLCAGAIGLLGISSGCRHPSAGGSCPAHDSHSSFLNFEERHRHAIAINESKIDAREEKDACIKYVGASPSRGHLVQACVCRYGHEYNCSVLTIRPTYRILSFHHAATMGQ